MKGHPALCMTSAGFVLIGLFFLVASRELPLGSAEQPGPGLFPLLVGCLITIIGGVLLVKTLRGRDSGVLQQEEFPRRDDGRRVLRTAVCMMLFAAFFDVLGYLTSTTIFTALLLRIFGMKGRAVAWGLALAVSATSYGLFGHMMDIPLPKGLLFP